MNKNLQHKIATDYWLEKTGKATLPEIGATTTLSGIPVVRRSQSFLLEEATAAALQKICNNQDTGIYAFLSITLYILVHKYTAAAEVWIASPTPLLAKENKPVTPLFLKAVIHRETTVRLLLQSFQEALKESYRHKDYPFEKFAEKYKTLFGPPEHLFNHAFSYLPLTGANEYQEQSKLSFTVRKTSASFELEIQHTSNYADWFVSQMGGHFQNILHFIINNPSAEIVAIPVLSAGEKQLLLETYNATTVDFPEKHLTLIELFEKQALQHPEQAAVQFAGDRITYRELQQRALAVATLLREKHVQANDIVALICDRSAHMITGMLGILKAGAAYLPIDADIPDDRIQYILEDSGAQFILTTQHTFTERQAFFHPYRNNVLLLDEITGEGAIAAPGISNAPNDTAYIIYTSGSTGRPKGVVATHSGVTNFVLAYKRVFKKGFNTTDRVLALSNISFDASIAEIFIALSSGATLVVLDKERIVDAAKLAAFLQEENITYAYVPPVLLKDLYTHLKQGGTGIALNKLFVGVEPIRDTLLYDYCTLIPGLDIINAYGPTETTVIASILNYKADMPTGEHVSIGKPIANYRIYILNELLEPAPAGVAGEICISGAGVTKGYLNNEALTADKFVDDPYQEGQKMYRSGDLARWDPEGNIVFTGRKDHQVKLRGYRIEPGEISSVLQNHPSIKEAVVCAFDDNTGSKYLCAYFVSSFEIAVAEIRAYLATRLPEYMIPARFVTLEKLPVTHNGKTDRKKLPHPESMERTIDEQDKPSDELEEKLVATWKEVLNIRQVGVNDNFFDLGGHSLKAARLITVILRDLYVAIPLREVFSGRSIRQLATYIRHAERSVQFDIPVAPASDQYPATFAQRGIYLNYLLNKATTSYNMPSAFWVEGQPDIPKLEAALKTVIERHAVLRTGFSFTEERIMQHVVEHVPFEISLVQDEAPDTDRHIASFVRPFDLSRPPLLRSTFIQQHATSGILLFDMHHIITDGISLDLFIKELLSAYHSATLPPLKIQYKDYAVWLEQYRQTSAFEENKQYWIETFTGRPAGLDLPIDYPRSGNRNTEGVIHSFTIGKDILSQLKKTVTQEGSTLFLLTLAAYNLLLAKYTGKKDITVGTPVAGRIHPDLDHLIGMFANTLPIKCAVDPQQPFTQLMEQLKNTFFTALDHQLYPMEELAEHLELVRDMNRNPLFDTLFSFQNIEIQALDIAGVSLQPLDLSKSNIDAKFDLSIDITESGDELLILIQYAKSLFKPSTIAQMAGHYAAILEAVAQSSNQSLDAIQLPGIDDPAYESVYPLTTTQRDIYLTCVLEPTGGSLRPLAYFEINGTIDVAVWSAAIKAVSRQEACLRSMLLIKDGAPFQAVLREGKSNFYFFDSKVDTLDAAGIHALVKQHCEDDQDLSKDPFRHYLFRINETHYVTAISAHHLFTDGTSLKLLIEKIDNAYHLLKEGKTTEEKPIPYKAYVLDHLAGFDTAAVADFWKQHLSELQPLSYSGTLSQADKIVADVLSISGDEALLIRDYCKAHALTPPVFFKAIFTLLTKYYCNADHDFCIRENLAGRSNRYPDTLGVFSHVFPLLVRHSFFRENTSFPELCAELQQQKRSANAYRYISLSLQNRIIGNEPLSFFYNYQHFILPETQTGIGPLRQVYHIQPNQVELRVLEQAAAFEIKLDYNAQIFNGEHFLTRVHHLLRQVLDENKPLHKLQFLTEEEMQQLNAFGNNAGPEAEKNILALFEEQVKQKPGNTAIIFKDKNITYAELDQASDAVAAHLQQMGVVAEDIIGIMVQRSEWMVIGMLGVLKAGAAYLPIDPEYPEERIAHLLNDSKAKLVLTDDAARTFSTTAVLTNDIALSTKTPPAQISINPSQAAYVIYTSGTTGKPKGVLMEHRALSNIANAWRSAYHLDGFEVRLLQMASFSFDVFTGDVVRALTNGGCMVICPSDIRLDVSSLYELMATHRINILESTPALVKPLMDYAYEQGTDTSFLKLLILGSDSCPVAYFRELTERYAPGTRILNSYGVTETCIDSSFYEARPDSLPASGNTPIGKPLLNYSYHVCNALHQRVPVGLPGELRIGGAGLARGYLNRDGLTAEKFITDPYTQERVYRTGDMVRWLPDGNLEFLGRKDDQVKLRGFRIELTEIESALLRDQQVKEAVVTIYGQENEQELVCWYTSQSGMEVEGLREVLKQQLPAYMVPVHFILLDRLPITANGKIDKKALPDPLDYTDKGRVVIDTPVTATENTLLGIWQEILKRNSIGMLDSFFELGGQSLRGMVLVSRIQKTFAVEISLKDIFTHPAIRLLASHIDNALAGHFVPITRAARQTHYPLSSAQKRVFVISHFKGAEISHNICGAHWVLGGLDVRRLETAFQSLTDRHESLRTSFSIVNDEPVQIIHDKVVFHLKHTYGEESAATSKLAKFIRKFDLGRAPLLRAEVLEVAPEKHLLLFDTHHIIGDEVSFDIFMRELWQIYHGEQLPELSIQYKDYAVWQQSLLSTGAIAKQQQYWMKQMAGDLPVMEFPCDFPRPLIQRFEGKGHSFALDTITASRVFNFISKKGVTLNMLMLAVYKVLLSKYTSQEDIIVGTPVAGRTHADLEPVIGMFVNTLALRSYPSAEKTFEQFLAAVKMCALSAYENQDYPFEELVEALQLKRDPSRHPLFDTLFQFISVQPGSAIQGLQFEPFSANISIAKFDLTFLTIQSGERIEFLLNYSSALFTEDTMQRLARHYCHVLMQVLDNPAISLREISLADEEEIRLLKTFGGTPEKEVPAITIPALWKEQVLKHSTATALETTHGCLTFAELDEQSTTLAIYLQEVYDVKPGDKVALMLQRTTALPVALLAVLKTGAAYVPVDPLFPAQRIAYMLADSACNMIISDRAFNHALPVLNIHAEWKQVDQREMKPVQISPADLAYIIYTSGSTGVPKGAMLEHGNVTGFARNLAPVYGIHAGDKILAISNITFDLSVLEILCSLLSGVCVLLADDAEVNDFPKIEEMVRKHKVNVLQMTPSRLTLFLNTVGAGIMAGIKTVITGGEPVPTGLFNALKRLRNTRVFTSCGPTETCIYSTTDEVKDNRITIGKPLLNEQIFIVGPHDQLQPINIAGEIYVAGSGVGRGYCNQETLTNEKYFRDRRLSSERIYRSGDIGRWLPDGRIECLGRKDTQVKLRGYRIELGEIESALGKMEGIKMTAAIVTDIKGEKQVAAFYESGREYGYATIRAFLADRLPTYMLPLLCIHLAKIPLTNNGKTDKKALEQLAQAQQSSLHLYEAPVGTLQKALAAIWKEILNIDSVSVSDNFFEIGGNSIKLIQVLSRIKKELAVNVPLTTAFTYPSIRALSGKIKMINEFSSVSEEDFFSVINAGKEQTIFCFPPAIAYSFIYTALAEYFPDHSICCFHFNESENRIAQYLQVINEMQPHQPLLLLGYSAGGNLAFEIAREIASSGREVSDIIMIDSYKRQEALVQTAEELEEMTQTHFEIVDWSVFSADPNYLETLKKITFNKIGGYFKYMNGKTDTGKTNARIHLVKSKDEWHTSAATRNWEENTTGGFYLYEGAGRHPEMFDPEYLPHNAGVIATIMQQVRNNSVVRHDYVSFL